LFYPSANRDKEVFADPFRFDIRRSPNPNVSFGGGGPHFCLGASLARTELQVMIGALLRRFDLIEITGEPMWMSAGPAAAVGVAVQSLPVLPNYKSAGMVDVASVGRPKPCEVAISVQPGRVPSRPSSSAHASGVFKPVPVCST
jgi:hypothetical protein